ncbi:MAG: type II toxin-antitoxin system Phd/YefM family antitoxin [Nitrospirota bacterium]
MLWLLDCDGDSPDSIFSRSFSRFDCPVSDLKVNPGKVISRNNTHRPALLTNRGRGVAVVQGLDDYEKTAEALQFIKAVAQGLADIREGNTVTLAEAKKILGK